MMSYDYVLCKWRGHLWPAKVLSRSGTAPKSKRKRALSIEVQILSIDETIKAKSTDIKALTESAMEAITSPLTCSPSNASPLLSRHS
uniref:PWWP domain-containing protein n=1 Tax=Prolemur simus TaxID=1328070 RepID=A0A8C8YYK9_PROSS